MVKFKSLVLLCFFFLMCVPVKNYAESPEKEINILVFFTNHQTLPWTQAYMKGLEKARLECGERVNFFIENLSTQYLGDTVLTDTWTDYFINKYKNIHIDAVLVESNIASKFFNEYGREIFKEIPFVYYLTEPMDIAPMSKALSSFDGIAVRRTLKLAFEQNPKAKHVYIIDGQNYGGNVFLQILLRELEKKVGVDVHILKDFSLNELKEQVAALPKGSILFYTLAFKDNTGKRFSPRQIAIEIGNVSSTPIYAFHTTIMSDGMVGGHMIDAETTAKEMVKAALDYIKKGYFEEEYINTVTQINWQSIKKYGIDTASVPSDAIVFNKPISLWESHFYEIIFTLSFIAVLLVLIFLLILKTIKLKSETILRIKQEKHLVQQSKMAAMGEMLSMITHQWRQPLSTIGMIQNNILLDMELEELEPKHLRVALGEISEQITHMSQTIEDFRNFFKPSAELKSFNVCEQILAVHKLLSAKFKALNVTFVMSQYTPFEVFGIPNELNQVLMNIYSNSCDVFEERNTQERKMEHFCENDGKNVIIRIRDTGGGISESLLPDSLFEAYISTKGQKGTGIGLWLSKTIIEEHFKGKLWAHNVDKGAEIVIELPISDAKGK